MSDFTEQSRKKSRERCNDPIVFVSCSSGFREQYLAQLKGAPLSVYLAYKSYANREGFAWPSLQSLARSTGYGINAVKRAKQILIEMGLLTPIEQSREGGQFGRKKFRVNTVALKQDHGTVAPSTVAPSTVAPKQCQEGSPSEGFPIKGNPLDAVRRPVDAEHHIAAEPFSPPSEGKTKAKPLERKAKLRARLANAIRVNGNQFEGGLDRDDRAVLQAAINAMRYDAKDFETLTDGFTFTLMEISEKHKHDEISPGNLCSKVIDRCLSEQKACKTLGSDPSEYYWPPDFQDHRDKLRARERAAEQQSGK
jgi:hypothetical protein